MIRIRLFVWALLALIGLASIASAQTPPPPAVTANQPFSVLADHDGQNMPATGAGYRLYICPGTVTNCTTLVGAGLPASARDVNGTVTFANVAGLAHGTYTAQFGAYNPSGEMKSPALTFTSVLPLPQAPRNLRFVVVTTTADGTPQMQLLDLAAARSVLELPPLN